RRLLPPFPTRRSSDLRSLCCIPKAREAWEVGVDLLERDAIAAVIAAALTECHLAARKRGGDDVGDLVDAVIELGVADVIDLSMEDRKSTRLHSSHVKS